MTALWRRPSHSIQRATCTDDDDDHVEVIDDCHEVENCVTVHAHMVFARVGKWPYDVYMGTEDKLCVFRVPA